MQLKKYIIFIVYLNNFISGSIVISLGERCESALLLRNSLTKHYGLRQEAYPFDWVISPFESLFRCLKEDFKNFLNPSYLSTFPIQDHASGMLDNYYGFQFIHDFPTMLALNPPEDDPSFFGHIIPNFLENLAPIKEKYNRRINRFRKALSGNKKVIFMRTKITQQQSLALYALIRSRYPKLHFTLVVIDSTVEMQSPWNMKGIKNYYVSNVWALNSLEWANILRSLGLIA